ncbi:MAG: extracellular solute-binding protein [Brevinematales bacterium]|nr:extracellular solute-binding protein [Brevinematales bacterium]
MNKILVLLSLIILTNQFYPKEVKPFGSPNAIKGGSITIHTPEFPKSFNYYVNNALDASIVFSLIYESLIEIHPETLEFMPLLAKSWSISDDKKTFIFEIDERAKWADGKPVTANDVLFTYETIMNPSNMTSVQRIFLSRFEKPVILGERKIKFVAKNVHYNNFITLGGLNILPKHLFEGKNFNRDFNNMLPPGSGPYILSEVKEGRYYVLKRREDYWGYVLSHHTGIFNFDRIKFKIVRDDNVAFEGFKKGDFDIFTSITAKRWVTETNSIHFQKNWILRKKIYNYKPQGFSGIALNMRKPIFKDKRIRQALFMLLDREELIKKLMYNEYKPLNSYWASINKNPKNIYSYNPEKAKLLLKEAGYDKLDKEGYLVNKNGERLEFKINYVTEAFEKHLTSYAESCKKVGIKVNLEILSWATLLKKLDNYDFDAITIGWSTSLFEDPEQLWHSKHINEAGGNNLPGYSNKEVDNLIDKLPPIFEISKRHEIIRKIDEIIYQDVPYILFWSANYEKIFYKPIFGMPETYLTKYGNVYDFLVYWWIDPEKEKAYKEAVKKKVSLPSEDVEIFYDKVKK